MHYPGKHFLSSRSSSALGAVLALGFGAVYGQVTTIAVGSRTLQTPVKRLGINLSFSTFYDSGQITKNLVFRNPGFEGEIFQSTIRCASGTANTCVDDDSYSGWPSSFWNGATVEFFYGQAQGRKESVAFYTAAHGTTGGTFTFQANGAAPATGDYMIVRMTVPGNATAGWWPTVAGGAAIVTNLTDLPPGTTGRQTVGLKAPGTSDVASLAAYFDTTTGRSFVALNGTFQLSFKAKGIGGANSIGVTLNRAGIPAYLSQTVKLSSDWDTYLLTFNASEAGITPGSAVLTFSTVGQDSFLLDDVSLAQTDTDPANTTAFRDPVVNALVSVNPGILRFWANQLGDTLDNLIAGPYARQRSGYWAFSNEQDDISYGIPDFLQLCETIGAEPWLVVPTTFSVTDASNLIEYLAGPATTPYGAKRAAGGHPAPWAAAFAKIHLEFGNEAWNSGFKGGSIEYPAPYGQRAQAIFAAMRGNGSYIASSFDLVLGGQAAVPLKNLDIQNNCNNNDTFALAPYMMTTVDTFATIEGLWGSTFAEGEAFVSPNGVAEGLNSGLILQNLKALQASTHPVPLALYEMNFSTTAGAITQAALSSYTSSLGAGLAVADSMLQMMRQGVLTQNLFSLQQYQFLRPDGKTVFLWGSVVDMGVTDRRRPQFLAMELINQAIGVNGPGRLPAEERRKKPPHTAHSATMIETVHSGVDPTWNQPLVNTVQLTGAHYLRSFAFSSGSRRSVIVFNMHRTSSLPVVFSDVNAPAGDVQMQRLTSGLPSDTNEDSAKVNITSQILTGFKPSTPLSLPPYSMTVLTWTAGGGANQAQPSADQ
jgi:hypothetical protein